MLVSRMKPEYREILEELREKYPMMVEQTLTELDKYELLWDVPFGTIVHLVDLLGISYNKVFSIFKPFEL